jgi:hypothetical protein
VGYNTAVGYLLFLLVIVVGVFDVVALGRWGQQATISFVVKGWSARFPILPFLMGLVIGHLLWPVTSDDTEPQNTRPHISRVEADMGPDTTVRE